MNCDLQDSAPSSPCPCSGKVPKYLGHARATVLPGSAGTESCLPGPGWVGSEARARLPRRAERRGQGDSSGGAPPGAGPRRGLGACRAAAADSPRVPPPPPVLGPPPCPPFREERPGARQVRPRRSSQVGSGRAPPPSRRERDRCAWLSGTLGTLGAGRARLFPLPASGRSAASAGMDLWSRGAREPPAHRLGEATTKGGGHWPGVLSPSLRPALLGDPFPAPRE